MLETSLNENGPTTAAAAKYVPSSSSASGLKKSPSKHAVQAVVSDDNERTRVNDANSEKNDDAGDMDDFSEQSDHEKNVYCDTINQLRFNCGMLVNNPKVQLSIVILISLNAIMMGIATYPFVKDDPHLNEVFEKIDLVFLIIFTIELFMQFVYHGLRLLLDGWLVFDLVIILISWSFSSVQVVRAFRIFRALRLVTRIKILKNLILALFGVVPRLAAIGLMLGLIFYIFAVMFTQLFGELHKQDIEPTELNYFGGLGFTLFTLFQMMTLDNWADICREAMATFSWAWIPFVAFVIISGFIMVNLIIAVICDAIASLDKTDKAMLEGGVEDDSRGSTDIELREQLDFLEEQMEELTKIQARTFHTLQYLTRQMQMHKLKKELTSKTTIADAARNLKKVQRELRPKQPDGNEASPLSSQDDGEKKRS